MSHTNNLVFTQQNEGIINKVWQNGFNVCTDSLVTIFYQSGIVPVASRCYWLLPTIGAQRVFWLIWDTYRPKNAPGPYATNQYLNLFFFQYPPSMLFEFLSTPLQAVLCTMVIFSNGKILNKLFGNYSLWYVSDYIISKSLRNLLGCKVLGLCHFEPFCHFNVLSYFLHDLFSPGGYLSMSIIPK